MPARAASQTSRAASAFMAAIAKPTVISGHAERQTNAIIMPVATGSCSVGATTSRQKSQRSDRAITIAMRKSRKTTSI